MDVFRLLDVPLSSLQIVLRVLQVFLHVLKHLALRFNEDLHFLEEIVQLVHRLFKAKDRFKLVLDLLDSLSYLGMCGSHHLLNHQFLCCIWVVFQLVKFFVS